MAEAFVDACCCLRNWRNRSYCGSMRVSAEVTDFGWLALVAAASPMLLLVAKLVSSLVTPVTGAWLTVMTGSLDLVAALPLFLGGWLFAVCSFGGNMLPEDGAAEVARRVAVRVADRVVLPEED